MKYRYWMCPCSACRMLWFGKRLHDWIYSRSTYKVSSELRLSELVILGFTWKTDAKRAAPVGGSE